MSFPTFTPQRPNAALYKFNVGESFLKGYQTVANVDLERAAEARMLEKNRLDAQIATQLLPLQADKLRAEIGLLGAQADRNSALAKYAGTSTTRQGLAAEEAYLDGMADNLITEKGLSVGSISPTYEENPAPSLNLQTPSLNLQTPITPLGEDEQPSFFLDDDLGGVELDDEGVFSGLPDAPQEVVPVSGAEGPELPKSQGQMNLSPAPLTSVGGGKKSLDKPIKLDLLPEEGDGGSTNPLTNLQTPTPTPTPTPTVKAKTPSQIYTDYMARQRIAWQTNQSFKNDKNNIGLRVQNKLWQRALVEDQRAMDGLYAPFGLDFQRADAIMKKFGGVPDILDRAVRMRQMGSPEDGVRAGDGWDIIAQGLSNQQTRLAAQLQQQNPSENKNIEKANTLYSMMEKEQDPEKRQGLGMIADALIKSGTPPEIQAAMVAERQNSLIGMTQFLSRPELNYLGEPIKDSENKIDAQTKIQRRAGVDYPVVSAKLLPDGRLDLDDNGISTVKKWYSDNNLQVPEIGVIPLMGVKIKTDNGIKVYPVQGAFGKDKDGTLVLGAQESYMKLPKLGGGEDESSAQETDTVASIEAKIKVESETQKPGSTKFSRERDARRLEVKKLEDAEDAAMSELTRAYELIRNPKLNKSDFTIIADRIKKIRLSQGDDPEAIDAYIREVTPWSWRKDETAKELNKWWGYEP